LVSQISNLCELTWRECGLALLASEVVEEAIPLLEPRKLIADNAEGDGPDEGALHGSLAEHSHEEIHIVHVLVQLLQLLSPGQYSKTLGRGARKSRWD
jgi:hypothetical protein